MARKIILISHSEFAYGLHKTMELIVGEQADVYSFGLLRDETPQSIIGKIKNLITPSDFVIILGDIAGGSMCNEAIKLLDLRNVILIGGTNLPLLIELVVSNANTKEEVREIVNNLKSSLKEIEKDKTSVTNDIDDFLDY